MTGGVKVYKRMLLPLDGSELAEVVFAYAKELVGRLGVEVILLNVHSPSEQKLAPMHRTYVERAAEIIRQQTERVRPKGRAVEVRGELAMGYPPEEILRFADENDIDIILMATHGRSGISRWAMGSVADKVLRASKVPVWLVRAGIPDEIVYDKWPRKTILVTLDGSELAELVLPHVVALTKQIGAELVDVVLLRVSELPVIPSDYSPDMPLSWEEHVEQEMVKCKLVAGSYLTEVEKRFKDAGLRVCSEVLIGRPADEIISYARRNPINLIVMATHGHAGMRRWAMGSIAGKVLLGVSIPIFLVRPQ